MVIISHNHRTMTRPPTIALLLCSLFAPLAIADAEEEAYRRMMEQQKKQQETYINRLELLPGGKRKIEDLVSVKMEDGKLVISSPLINGDMVGKMKNRQMRADVEGFEGFCTVMVQNIGAGGHYFTFANTNYPDLSGVCNYNITVQPNYLQVSKNLNSRKKNININLIQTKGRERFGQPDGVQLNVYAGDRTGRQNVAVNLSETDFVTLRRKHPREVNEHLRPLLRELKLENLFVVDTTTAWQVFADEWKRDDVLAAKVREQLVKLDSDSYKERESATASLMQLGPQGALVMFHMSREGLSNEQNSRLDSVVASFSFLPPAEATRMRTDIDFLLDCLYCEDQAVRAVAVKYLERTTRRTLTFDITADYEARSAAVETLRGELARGATTKSAKS